MLVRPQVMTQHGMMKGPGTVNVFRNMLGLPEAKWQEKEEGQEQEQLPGHDFKQSTLSDFLS